MLKTTTKTTILIILGSILTASVTFNYLNSVSTPTNPIPEYVGRAFNIWKAKHGVNSISPSEDEFRLKIFHLTYLKAKNINEQNLSWRAGLNRFAAMTEEEFKVFTLGVKELPEEYKQVQKETPNPQGENLPNSIDWVAAGAISKKPGDQGVCGSCWAFASTGAAEGAYNIYMKTQGQTTPKKFSEQQILDCVEEAEGCNGGWSKFTFKYLIKTSGAADESAYPYEGRSQPCRKELLQDVTPKFSDWQFLDKGNTCLDNALTKAPVSITAKINDNFRIYQSGVFSDPSCSEEYGYLHNMVAVGYQRNPQKKSEGHYVLKNSWGTNWGEDGFMRIERIKGYDGTCSMHMSSSYVIFKE